MVGNETLPIILGRKCTRRMIFVMLVICAAVLVLATRMGWVTKLGYYLLLPVAYAIVSVVLYSRRKMASGMGTEIAANTGFFLSGLVSVVYYFVTR